jgi:hypothetical protein
MFAQRFSFLRRLIGGGAAAPETVKTDERRLWVRYPADLDTSVQLADHPGEDRVPARIRDLSRGGANLVLDQGFPTGQLLSLEMPCPEDPERIFQILACIVRSTPEPGGRHSLGCVFSRELTEEDLFSFGARRVRHAPEDQRSWMRFACELKATFNKIGESESAPRAAQVKNVSASGVGLEVDEAIEVGSLLNLHVVGKMGQERTLLTCVVHAVKQGGANWQLGCNFIRELSESDFQDMM